MGFNFPSSPTEGQVFDPGGTLPDYVYRSGKWKRTAGTASKENILVNPAMQISQEMGDTATLASLTYIADQWQAYEESAVGVIQSQRVQVVTPRGSANRLRVITTTADPSMGTTEYAMIFQYIEGTRIADLKWGTAAAKQVVLRFGFKAPMGFYNVVIGNQVEARSYLIPFSISSGQANTDTEWTFVIPGDTTGTWPVDNTPSLWIGWTLASGKAWGSAGWNAGNYYNTINQSNFLQTMSNTVELFDVGLYADPNKTGRAPEWEAPSYANVLDDCLRYFQKVYGLRGVVSTATNGSRCGTALQVPMRVAPSLAIKGGPLIYDGAVTPAITAIGGNLSQNRWAVELELTTAGGMAQARPAIMFWTSINDYIQASARM
jgi:hypothetical protein